MPNTKKNISRNTSRNNSILKKKSKRKTKTKTNSSDILTSRVDKKKYTNTHPNESNDSLSFTIKYNDNKFFSRTQTVIKRGPKPKIVKKDPFALFITDNKKELMKGKTIYNNKLDKYIFNESETKCVCENLFKKPNRELHDDCECGNIKTYSSQGKSGAKIHSIMCNKRQEVLKTISLKTYYINMRAETNKYMFIEMDGFSIQTIINTYVHRELPTNTVNIINSGVCGGKKNKVTGEKQGYNLMEEANLGSGRQFFLKLLDKFHDDEFNINSDEDKRYVAIVNFLLQVVLIIGHLQSSPLEFFHGDYKPENVFVTRSDKKTTSRFVFNVFGKEIKVKNLGFAVLIADFDRSSITIEDEFNPKKYRIISPILFKPLFTSIVNNIIKKYGDIDPDNIKNTDYEKPGVKIEKLFVSNLIPRKMDPTITILRSAGVKLYRDFDLYTFFIRLIETENVRKYFLEKKLNTTIMSFMSKAFLNDLYSKPAKEISLNESAYLAVEIFGKIKEPMLNVFTDEYITRLQSLNYKLFK